VGHPGRYDRLAKAGPRHIGKGPKGYVRSDERIREDVCDRLCDDDEVDASEMTVSVKAGEVLLEGFASDRYSKHRAESIAESVNGVRDVVNHLRVLRGTAQGVGP
jgi:osmotically-inducible protein OsmY